MTNKVDTYIKQNGEQCLNCGEVDISGTEVNISGNQAFQDMGCDACEASWTDVWQRSHVSNVEIDGYPEAQRQIDFAPPTHAKAALHQLQFESIGKAVMHMENLERNGISFTQINNDSGLLVIWATVTPPALPIAPADSHAFTLIDEALGDEIQGNINVTGDLGVALSFEGYSDSHNMDGCGSPVYIEKYDGQLLVRIYADINSDAPTHSVSLEGARTSSRLPPSE